MACRWCGAREEQCCCQHVHRVIPPEPRYATTNNNFRPQNYSSLLNHEAYINIIPRYSQSRDSNPIGSESTHQLQEPDISYSSGYAPSTDSFCPSTGQTCDSSSLSSDPRAFTNNAHLNGSSVGWAKQIQLGDEGIQLSIANPWQSTEPEAGWPSLGTPDAQRSFDITYPSTNFTSMKSSQPYPPGGYDLSGCANNREQDRSQQNNLVASGNEEIHVAMEYESHESRINQPGTVLRGSDPSGTSEALYSSVNTAQPQYSSSYSYDHSQIQEPFTVVTTNQEPTSLDNQAEYSSSSAISDSYQLPCICPHPKCRRNNSTKTFTESSGFQAHWYRSHDKRFSCPDCKAVFGTAAEVRRHSTAIHVDGPKEFTCEIPRCAGRSQEFNRKHRLKEHMEKWHGYYYCSAMGCSRGRGHGFKDQTLLNEHLIKSHGHGGFR
ncbi:uncharacterized protein EAF01_011235 [Botrytis porri]|nr:uncharacterized protein EAF01_011235 [Botrytis porri]KAF7886557.1 hypothetical protein EAF01_011235 [Botrytis porri]